MRIGRIALALSIAAVTGLGPASPASAGPPCVCWPIDIGTATSLPWKGTGGFSTDPRYDTSRLVRDVLALLDAEAAPLVRMETIRRATAYMHTAEGRHGPTWELFSRLAARTLDAETGKVSRWTAWFDVGYLAAAYRQIELRDGIPDPTAWLDRAASLAPPSPEVQLALALAKRLDGDAWKRHAKKAAEGAAEGSLLAKNLLRLLGEGEGDTLAALRSRLDGEKGAPHR